MLVILAIAAIAVLACVVLVSLGKGGELTEFPPDVPPLDLPEPGQLTAVDFMALQLPVNLVGYHTASVDETLRKAAGAISARDTRIAVLEQRVSELLASRLQARQEVYAAPGNGLRTDHSPPASARELPESGDPVSASGASVSWDGGAELRHLPEGTEWRVPKTDGDAADAAADESADADADDVAEPVVSADEPAAVDDEPVAAAGQPVASEAVGEEDEKPDERIDDPEEAADALKPGDEGSEGGQEPVRAAMGKDGDERS
ncbi:hypothetical protein ACTMTI_22510 [Nonomuraea sp. H19]|uniref:hypothetical protein n=1 Tax=Nonomuraea sp. H19 TaxID=3452206 RepID=UPI003F89840E